VKKLQEAKRAQEARRPGNSGRSFVLDWVQLRDEVEDLRLRADYSLDHDEARRAEDTLETIQQYLNHVSALVEVSVPLRISLPRPRQRWRGRFAFVGLAPDGLLRVGSKAGISLGAAGALLPTLNSG